MLYFSAYFILYEVFKYYEIILGNPNLRKKIKPVTVYLFFGKVI